MVKKIPTNVMNSLPRGMRFSHFHYTYSIPLMHAIPVRFHSFCISSLYTHIPRNNSPVANTRRRNGIYKQEKYFEQCFAYIICKSWGKILLMKKLENNLLYTLFFHYVIYIYRAVVFGIEEGTRRASLWNVLFTLSFSLTHFFFFHHHHRWRWNEYIVDVYEKFTRVASSTKKGRINEGVRGQQKKKKKKRRERERGKKILSTE